MAFRLFTQPFVQVQIKENVEALRKFYYHIGTFCTGVKALQVKLEKKRAHQLRKQV